jgi:anti-anti-sigma factor
MITTGVISRNQCELAMEERGQYAVISISGDLNWHSVERMHETVTTTGGSKLLIDLSDLTAMDSAGTAALISTYLQGHRAGRQIAIVAAGFSAAVLHDVGLSEVVPVFEDRPSGARWLAGA